MLVLLGTEEKKYVNTFEMAFVSRENSVLLNMSKMLFKLAEEVEIVNFSIKIGVNFLMKKERNKKNKKQKSQKGSGINETKF